jgi:hypothetical protein
MFTIIQQTFRGTKFFGYEVVGRSFTLSEAQHMAAKLCDHAGVVRTLVLDEMGGCVGIES